MIKEEFYFDSYCGTNKIRAVKWVPDGAPLCVLQIVHGMAEYVERYEEFAAFLVEHNIIVVGEDHLGHGKSMGNNPPGYFCESRPRARSATPSLPPIIASRTRSEARRSSPSSTPG